MLCCSVFSGFCGVGAYDGVSMMYSYTIGDSAIGFNTAAGSGLLENITGNDQYLVGFSAFLKNNSASPTGLITAVLMSDVYTIIETSSTVEDVPSGTAWYNFTFSGSHLLEAGQGYTIAVREETAVSPAGGIAWVCGGAGTGYSYYRNGWAGSWMAAGSNYKLDREIFTSVYAGGYAPTPSPTPTPTASPVPTATPEYPTEEDTTLWNNIFEYIMLFLVLLVPALLLWWKAGKWGFVTGLIVGAVISYMFFGLANNLWGIILVGSTIFVAVLAATRGGN